MPDILLALNNIHKSFGAIRVLNGIDLQLCRGEFFTLLGASGCGKTTALRIIAGLESPDEGTVVLNGKEITGMEPNMRNVNTVFQNYALFPYYNVAQNVAYGLKVKKTPRKETEERTAEALRLVQMEEYAARMPNELSGGQRQRIAIARAIVNRPDVLLLDEPLGALDLKLRKQMQYELKHLQKTLGITFVYVTHDQEEALAMSDRIGVINGGIFEQIASPRDIYRRPQSEYVAGFVGETNFIRARALYPAGGGRYRLRFSFGEMDLPLEGVFAENSCLLLSLRPEHIYLKDERERQGEAPSIPAVVEETSFRGASVQTIVRLKDGSRLLVSESAGQDHPEGSEVEIFWKPKNSVVVRIFEDEPIRAAV
jgi:spermidine/putrescine transport system ATP-binding protein